MTNLDSRRAGVMSGRTCSRMLVALLCLVAPACTNGGDSPDPLRPASRALSLRPRFYSEGSPVALDGLTRARITVVAVNIFGQATHDTIDGPFTFDLQPGQPSWSLSVSFDLKAGHDRVALLGELIKVDAGVESVEWSGVTAAIELNTIEPGARTDLPVFRGPPANLEITSIHISNAPQSVLEDDSVRLTIDAQGGSPATRTFWTSSDTAVARFGVDGTLHALRDGRIKVFAVAGAARDSAIVEVRARAASIQLTPDTLRSIAVGENVRFIATVRDARGAILPFETLTWSSANEGVLSAGKDGVFTARAIGVATVRAVSTNTPGVAGTAAGVVTSRIAANLHLTWVGTNPSDQAAVGSTITIIVIGTNNGTVQTPAAFARLLIKDAVTGAIAFDTLLAQPSIAPGVPITLVTPFTISAGRVWPASVRFSVITDALNSIPETDELDNVAESDVFLITAAPRVLTNAVRQEPRGSEPWLNTAPCLWLFDTRLQPRLQISQSCRVGP